MHSKAILIPVLAGVVLLFAAATANSGYISYSDRSTFQAAAGGGLTLEGFNTAFNGSPSIFPVGGSTLFTVTSGSGYVTQLNFLSLVSEGTDALGLREGDVATFVFNNPVNAVGFDVNELNSSAVSYADSAGNSIANAVAANHPVPSVGSGSTFFGITSDTAFTSFTLTTTGNFGAIYAIDALEFGTSAVPVPSAFALLGIGLAGIGYQRRTKQRMG